MLVDSPKPTETQTTLAKLSGLKTKPKHVNVESELVGKRGGYRGKRKGQWGERENHREYGG